MFYYKKTNKNKNVIRKYTNYSTYLSVAQGIHSAAFLYSGKENIIDRLFIYFNYHLEYYENMLFIDNVSRSLFKTYSMKMLILSKIQIKTFVMISVNYYLLKFIIIKILL